MTSDSADIDEVNRGIGKLFMATGIAAGSAFLVSLVAPPLAAFAVGMFVFGFAAYAAGIDDDDAPPTADDLEDQP